MKNIRFFAIFGLLTLLVSSCISQQTSISVVQPTAYSAEVIADYFPLSKGAYWIYEGIVKWQIGTDFFEKTIQWKMEVIDVVQRTNATGFQMQGAPWDLAFYEDGKKPSEYSFIKVGSSRYYQGTIDDYQRMLDKNDFLMGLVKDRGLFLDIPLIQGERICDDFSITRDDPQYCWYVSEGDQIQLADVKGITADKPTTEFVISQSTIGDGSRFHFVPGIGITQYMYSHHGTVSEVDIHLIEYHAGK